VHQEDWASLGKTVQIVGLNVRDPLAPYHLRLPASIFLAESSRQVGVRAAKALRERRLKRAAYDNALKLGDFEAGVVMTADQLLSF
jgi:hypothetical protein